MDDFVRTSGSRNCINKSIFEETRASAQMKIPNVDLSKESPPPKSLSVLRSDYMNSQRENQGSGHDLCNFYYERSVQDNPDFVEPDVGHSEEDVFGSHNENLPAKHYHPGLGTGSMHNSRSEASLPKRLNHGESYKEVSSPLGQGPKGTPEFRSMGEQKIKRYVQDLDKKMNEIKKIASVRSSSCKNSDKGTEIGSIKSKNGTPIGVRHSLIQSITEQAEFESDAEFFYFVGDTRGELKRLDMQRKTFSSEYPKMHQDDITVLAITADKKFVFTGDSQGVMMCSSVPDQIHCVNYGQVHETGFSQMAVGKDNNFLFTLGKCGDLKQWRVKEKNLAKDYGPIFGGKPAVMCLTDNSEYLFIADRTNGQLRQFLVGAMSSAHDYGQPHQAGIDKMICIANSNRVNSTSWVFTVGKDGE
jgi:hypothetical protein